jgi:Ca-activated chloride channel family protein
MRFALPQMLWLLAVTVSLLAWFLWWGWRKKQFLVAQFVQSRLLAQLTIGVSQARQKIRLALIVFAVACAMLALARPQWGFDWEEVKQRGLDIVVAIDTSRSMLADDVQPNRLARAKLGALDLMNEAKSDRLALIPFAGAAFLQCPLTLDEQAFRQSVEALEVGIIPVGGTALTEAIETALTAFKEGENFKILVLLTDGEDHDSGALAAAEKAAKAGLKVFTVGLGTANGELLRATDEKGGVSYIKDEQGNVVKSRLNESLLQQIATATGGFYLPLRGANSMQTLYDKGLAPLPKSEISERLIRRYHERYQWPLALALAALLAEMFLPERKRVAPSESIVQSANAELRRAVGILMAMAVLTCLSIHTFAATEPEQEDEQYRHSLKEPRQLEKRLKQIHRQIAEYEDRLKKNPNDPRLYYNRGTFAYEMQDYETAATNLQSAVTAPDLKLQQRASYNLGNTLYRQGEQAAAVDQKIAAWEKAVQSFENATHLDPQDADAKFNLELVKKKLEELKKQQPKQDKQNKPDNQQNEKEKQDRQQQSDSSKQQDQQQQPNEQKQEQKPEQKPEQEPKPQDQKSDQPPNDPQEKDSNQKDAQQDQAKQHKPEGAGKGDDTPGEQTDAKAAPGQMTVQQAQQLLESTKGDERAMIFVPEQKLKDRKRSFKDW